MLCTWKIDGYHKPKTFRKIYCKCCSGWQPRYLSVGCIHDGRPRFIIVQLAIFNVKVLSLVSATSKSLIERHIASWKWYSLSSNSSRSRSHSCLSVLCWQEICMNKRVQYGRHWLFLETQYMWWCMYQLPRLARIEISLNLIFRRNKIPLHDYTMQCNNVGLQHRNSTNEIPANVDTMLFKARSLSHFENQKWLFGSPEGSIFARSLFSIRHTALAK